MDAKAPQCARIHASAPDGGGDGPGALPSSSRLPRKARRDDAALRRRAAPDHPCREHAPEHCNLLSRRAGLRGTASCAAMPVALLERRCGSLRKIRRCGILDQTDPHVGWWLERQRLDCEAKNLEAEIIASTMPTTGEGLALVARVLLMWYEEFHVDGNDWKGEVDQIAGMTLARHLLERTPADKLRRAGLGTV
jgi:hypothetical protein